MKTMKWFGVALFAVAAPLLATGCNCGKTGACAPTTDCGTPACGGSVATYQGAAYAPAEGTVISADAYSYGVPSGTTVDAMIQTEVNRLGGAHGSYYGEEIDNQYAEYGLE